MQFITKQMPERVCNEFTLILQFNAAHILGIFHWPFAVPALNFLIMNAQTRNKSLQVRTVKAIFFTQIAKSAFLGYGHGLASSNLNQINNRYINKVQAFHWTLYISMHHKSGKNQNIWKSSKQRHSTLYVLIVSFLSDTFEMNT